MTQSPTSSTSTMLAVEHHRLLVVGAGIAGLSAALESGRATLVVDGEMGGGSSRWAQGGMAAALHPSDSPAAHAADTVAVSGGVGDPGMARSLAGGAPPSVRWLRSLGARFDVDAAGVPVLGREAGHGIRRIVHANGDATGAEVMRVLCAAVRAAPGITVVERTRVLDLLWADGVVVGVVAMRAGGQTVLLLAEAVVLATGGYGHLFARTTNPPEVGGAAVAMAARAGVSIADVEMVQFHPTALAVCGQQQLPLLTEALRGEGAVLVNELGERFMVREHPDAELAPRDVVARANYRQLGQGHTPMLDARAAIGETFPDRFPTVFALARRHGFDPRVEPLPVTPAAHYCMGGVATDAVGRTAHRGLWVVGEAASSGVHGANRLASNSLVEGVVMGRAAAAALREDAPGGTFATAWVVTAPASVLHVGHDDPALLLAVRNLLWSFGALERSGAGLEAGLAELDSLRNAASGLGARSRDALAVAELMLAASQDRQESRGAHFRTDHPQLDPAFAHRQLRRAHRAPTVALAIEGERAVVVDSRVAA